MTLTDAAIKIGCPIETLKAAVQMLYPHASALTYVELQAVRDYLQRVKTSPKALSYFEQYQRLAAYKVALLDRMRLVDRKQEEIVRLIDARNLTAAVPVARKELFPKARAALNAHSFLQRR